MRRLSEIEELFALHIRADRLDDGMVREYRFHPSRKWRFDFAWPERLLAVEIEGGIWMERSAHNGGSGVTRDIEKSNAALMAGWRVLRFTADMVRSGQAVIVLAEAFDVVAK